MNNDYKVNPHITKVKNISDIRVTTMNQTRETKQVSKLLALLLGVLMWLCAGNLFAQQELTVTGTVVDAKGEGIPGVTVVVKGSTNGTTTAPDGKYELSKVSSDATLVFESVGLATQEIAVNNQSVINVTMTDDIKLDEVVIVGYGTQQKKDVTSAITTLSEKDLNQGPITNPLQQLNGRAAGVAINQTGSEPGVAPNVRIRGITSLSGGNDPLVVIDGVQGNMGLLAQLPPSEIQSIDVLKDASATAIYGSRGAAGVILVTTKKGKEGKTTIEYNGVASLEVVARTLNMMKASQYREEAARRGITGFDNGGDTDWFKSISRPGFTQNHSLAVSGGNKDFDYRASVTAILQNGIIKKSDFSNYIGRIQATQRALNDKLTLTYNLNLSLLENNWNNNVQGAFATRPTNPIYGADGSYFVDQLLFDYTNPYARVMENIDNSRTNNIFASLKTDYEIIEGLTASVFGSWRKTSNEAYSYQSRLASFYGKQNGGVANRSNNSSDEKIFNFILNYRKTFAKDHTISATFVNEWQKQIYEGNSMTAYNFINDLLGAGAIQTAGTIGIPGSSDPGVRSYKNDRTLSSFLGRVSYTFQDKYNLTASLRRDGASVFGANNKWANFWSVSSAWTLSNESFIKNLNIFDNLKLRFGYGVTGNQQGLGPLNSVLRVGQSGTAFFAGSVIPNFAIIQNANPDLRWETKSMWNGGLDFTLLKGKLTGTIDAFYGFTRDLLYDYTVPSPPFPFNSIKANAGTILNQGLEVTLNYNLLESKDGWNVTLGGNFTTVRTRVTELSGSLPNNIPLNTDYQNWGGTDLGGVGGDNAMSYLIKGQPLGVFNLYRHVGIDDNGNQIVDDLDGNGTVEAGRISPDRQIVGQVLPKFTYAFTPTVSYKKFDLAIVLRGGYGNSIFNARRAQLSNMSLLGQSNLLQDAPALGLRQFAPGASASDLWLEDGSFARLENLTIGYNLGTLNQKSIQNVRISFTTNNLFLITNYKGIDPEVNLSGGGGSGIDTGIYPRTRNFALGLNIIFK